MKTSLFLFYLLIILSGNLAAQNKIDSLEKLLTQNPNDSIRLGLLKDLTNRVHLNDPSKYITYIQQGIELSKKVEDYDHLGGFYMHYSKYLAQSNSIDSALNIIETAILLKPKTKKLQNRIALDITHAQLLEQKGDFSNATKKYLIALKIAEKEQYTDGLVGCYNGLSGVFLSQKMYDKAIEYNKKCAGVCDELQPHRTPFCFATTYSNLGIFYLKKKQIDSALHYTLLAIEKKKAIKHINGLYHSYFIGAICYLKKKDTTRAIQFYEESLSYSQRTNNIKGLSQSLLALGKIYITQKNIKALPSIFTQLDSIMPNIQESYIQVNYFQVKSNYLELKKDYKSALELVKNQFNMVDSIRKEKNTTLIASLETKYETQKHKLEKELAQKELLLSDEKAAQHKRNLIGVSIFSLLIVLLLLYIISRWSIIKQQKTALNKAYNQLELQKQNEVALLNLKALQAQMNPHFLFNALNSIQDLVLMKDIKNSTIYLGKFSALIRKILLSSKEQFISLDQELDILKLYLDLEKLRFGNQLEITFNSNVLAEDQNKIQLPAMFIQPYIENAIKHGLFHKKGLKKLLVEFNQSKDSLTCIIEDNGIGQVEANKMKEKTLHLHTGFSTEAIKYRIQFLNQTLNKKISVETEDLMDGQNAVGTRVTLLFAI